MFVLNIFIHHKHNLTHLITKKLEVSQNYEYVQIFTFSQ